MPVSYKLPLLAFVGVGAATGGGYFLVRGLMNSNYKTMKDKLGESWMSDSESSTKWEDRKTTLTSASEASLVEDLKNIKNNSPTGEKIKEWCSNNASIEFTNDKDTRFLNVKTYCTYKMKDKLTKSVREQGDSDWATSSNKIKTPAQGTVLSPAMEKIKEALNRSQSPDNDALKHWCRDMVDSMYENNSDFKDADSYCTKG